MNRVKLPIWPWKTWYVLVRVPPSITSTPSMPLVMRPVNSPMAMPRSKFYPLLGKIMLTVFELRWQNLHCEL